MHISRSGVESTALLTKESDLDPTLDWASPAFQIAKKLCYSLHVNILKIQLILQVEKYIPLQGIPEFQIKKSVERSKCEVTLDLKFPSINTRDRLWKFQSKSLCC